MSRQTERLLCAIGSLILLGFGALYSARIHSGHWHLYALLLLLVTVAGYAFAEHYGWLGQYYERDLDPHGISDGVKRHIRTFHGLLVVASTFAVSFAYLGLTGGMASPFYFILFQPLMLLTLRYGARAGLIVAAGIACAYLWGPGFAAWGLSPQHVAAAISFPCMALFAAIVTTRLRRAAKQLSHRLNDLDSLIDVTRMLETALDLKTTIDLILLNVPETIPFSRCAIYLTDPVDGVLRLKDTVPNLGNDELIPAMTITDHFLDRRVSPDDLAITFVRILSAAAGGTVLSPQTPVFFDASAQSVVYVPMRGPGGIVGVLCMARDSSMAPFRQIECAHIGKFAAHVALNLQQALYRDRLEQLAFQDVMTGLANYRYFERRLGEEMSRCSRYGHQLSVIMLDIDYFKSFNDTWGHRAGDALLAQFGVVLRNTLRDADLPARYGGEEFVVVCPETSAVQAEQICERLRAAVAGNVFTLPGKHANETAIAHVTTSIGYATFPADALTAESLVRLADRALYAAKLAGRNRWMRSGDDPDMPAVVNG